METRTHYTGQGTLGGGRFFPDTYQELVCKPTLFGCESDIEQAC